MKFLTIASSAILALAVGTEMAHAAECSKAYYQCGGKNWKGPTCCESGSTCVDYPDNPWYSQCVPNENLTSTNKSSHKTTTTEGSKKTTTSTTTTKASKKTTTTEASKKTTTTEGSKKTTTTEASKKTTTTTTKKASTSTSSSSSASTNYSAVSGGASGNGETTRYWDCCKPSCSWPGKADVTSPVGSCNKDGKTLADNNTQNGCVGGSSYTCNDNQPWVVSDDLAYGFAAASISGGSEATWCCACFELTFTSTAIKGKKMVVQVTNTGSDLGSNTGAHFDLQMPGGGVGIYNGCATQWDAPTDGWGARYGGVSSASDCSNLPSALQAGCKWRFGWFENADNPTMTYKQVTCPKAITAKSGCSRK
ncbi:hypothetical protein G6F62_008651 [Rhizopus arrhizus]|uniref:Cellulase n=1 Tax=Rhizopus oryzae TaxID=64495 RepID=A0A9P7BV89_RHIOR|nr:hypothetical protein G6F24_002533 [Rhizopus arrhizus]KAG0918745.1 hypothetical protein G6F33_000254 [Rhizopus arrhizus]KAG1312609.1 hypothetical protein G6F64_002890 [Rhizopus arrhizus]KAG1325258.1 hypothetical protein G6F62_008651 [Rhizopus arrhizus]